MTWTLVQNTATVIQSASGGSVTGTLPAGSTAGNLLVALLASGNGGSPFSGPSGWTQGPAIGNGSFTRSEIWYYVGNPGGISSATFTSGTGSTRCVLAEFSTNVAGTVALDFSGTGSAGTVAQCTATASATSGDLAVCVFMEHFGSNQTLVWTDPSGFTVLAKMNGPQNNLTYTAYELSTAAGSLSVTGKSNIASGSTSGWSGAVATFTVNATASQSILVGATVSTKAFPGDTQAQANAAFVNATGRPRLSYRGYFTPGSFPINANGSVDLSQQGISSAITAGLKCVVSFKPAFNPPSQADYNKIVTVLTAYQNAGLNADVGLWHEPENPQTNMSAAQYGTMSEFYAGAVTPFFPFASILTYWSVGGDPQNFTSYFNAAKAGTFSKAYIDFYCDTWRKGGTLDGAAAAVDAQGIPFGIGEWGCSITNDGLTNCKNYIAYIQSFFASRLANGQLCCDIIWFNNGLTGQQIQAITTSSDARVPAYQAMFDALTTSAGGSGTVTIGAGLRVVASATATTTGGAPQPQTPANPGATGPPGFPVLVSEIGVVPTAPVPGAGVFLLDDPAFGLLNLDTLGGSTQWADISAYVKSFTITRTSTRQNAPVITYDPGTESSVLDNTDGRFDPDNLTSPYVAAGVTQLHPMTPKRTQAVWQGTKYRLFTGYADSWITPDTNYGPYTQEMDLAATDGFKVLAGFQLAASAEQLADLNEMPFGPGDDTGARISGLLDLAGWDNDARSIDAGNSQLQGSTLQSGDALTEMQLSADTELGELYVDGRGRVTFRRRHGVMEDARSSNPQAVFGDSPGAGGLLNSNPGFEGTGGSTAGWQAQNGATLTAISTTTFSGGWAGEFAGNGSTASPQITTTPNAAVTPGQYVTFSAWVNGLGLRTWPVTVTIQFFTGGGTHLTASDITVQMQMTLSTWQQVSLAGFVPSGAATAAAVVAMPGTPDPTVLIVVDEAYLSVSPELPYSGLGRNNDDTQLCNDAQVTAAGSANLQEAQDAASIARFLYPRSYSRSDLLLESDSEALSWAQFIVYISKGAEDRFDTITLSPQRDARLWPQVLGREIGDMIAVIRRPPNSPPIAKQLIIRGITHTVTVSPASWQTQWILQDASRYSFLTLGDPVQGILGSNGLAY